MQVINFVNKYIGRLNYMDGYKYHKYLIYGGNNSSAIEAALLKRGNWQSVLKERVLDANFIWKPLNFPNRLYMDIDDIMKYGPTENFLMNHFEHNNVITTKAGLIKSLKYYYSHQQTMISQNSCLSDSIPTTFILNAHVDNTEYRTFKQRFQQLDKKNFNREKVPRKHCEKNIWFLKPDGQNQGKGIMLSNDWKQIQAHLISKPVNTVWVAQKAIQKPLLYQERKFDIRVWVLVTPQFQIYYYKVPYMRTSNQLYNIEALDGQIHLTNNFQQKKYKDYSKYEHGNTIPLSDLQKFLKNDQSIDSEKIMNDIIARMKCLILDSLNSAKKYFTKAIRKKQFELFGYDFLIDQDYRTWLIEVNNNPYLGCPNNFIKNLIPLMIDEMLEIIVDPYFRPANYAPVATKNFELIHKQTTSFRITPGRVSSSQTRKKLSLAKQLMSPMRTPRKLNPVHCSTNQIEREKQKQRPKYLTPQQSIKYLLETYCYTDCQPFIIPVNLVLSSPRLQQQSQLQSNIKTLRMICNTRISSILLQKKFMDLCSDLIRSDKYHQKIKALLIQGYEKAIKIFSNRIAVIKSIVPAISEILLKNSQLQQQLITSIISLLIKLGGYLQRKIFIPGQSRQNQFARDYFIKSNTMSLLIYLKQKYPQVNKKQVEQFIENVNQKDWQTYEQITQITEYNTQQMSDSDPVLSKRLSINPNVITDDKPRVHSRRQVTEARNLRARRQTAFPVIKK